jgi:hypothetical protein
MNIEEVRKQGHPRFYELIDCIKEFCYNQRYEELLNEMAEVHARKNAGYAGKNAQDPLANFRMSEKVGVPAWQGAMIRWTDKVIRIRNLRENPASDMVGESMIDTLLDLANYSLLIVIMIEEISGKNTYDYYYDSSYNSKEFDESFLPYAYNVLNAHVEYIFNILPRINLPQIAQLLFQLVDYTLQLVIQLETKNGATITPSWLLQARKEGDEI